MFECILEHLIKKKNVLIKDNQPPINPIQNIIMIQFFLVPLILKAISKVILISN